MLPNWLYGKSKSKLTSILGGGGTPADYDQVKAQVTQNAEDILLISDALDDKAALTQISNPNLLDNPWFTVNQRGQSSYTTDNAYTCDRWKKTAGTVQIGDGITLISTSSNGLLLQQFIDNATINALLGRTVTLTFLMGDGTFYSESATIPATLPSENSKIISIDYPDAIYTGLYVNNSETNKMWINIGVTSGEKTVTIRAVKLELGSISTLAMDVAPNYETELSKCERYFMRLYGNAFYAFAIALAVNTANADFIINLPTGMISQPTVSTSGTIILTDGSNTVNLSGISIVNYIKGIASILNMRSTVETGASLTAGKVYKIAFNSSDAYIDLSAEL